MNKKWIQLYVRLAGAILLAAALERFFVAAGHAQILSLAEPVMGIPLRYAVLIIGGLEFTVALVCLFGKRNRLQLGLAAWLATNCAVYRIGLPILNCHPQTTCIGSLTDPISLSRGTPAVMTAILPFYLLLGSYAALIWLWLEKRRVKAASFLKMSCPACGVHIRFDNRNVGRKIPCPHCDSTITLQRPEDLKMSCFFCKEHIEFPAHAIGTRLACPHCKMDITLKQAI